MTTNTPIFSRNVSWIIPILIGIISLLGICVTLASVFLPKQESEFVATRTLTPFKYQFLATETLIPAPTAETAELPVAPIETSDIANPDTETTPIFVTTEQNGSPPEEFSTPIPTITLDPIFDNFEPLTVGTYDDADYGFTYIGVWNVEENIDAYLETVLVSDTVGDYMAFSFTGHQMGLGYQSSDDAGEITINIDGSEWTITQQVGNLWNSDEFEPGTHYVIITHTGEGPINVDYVQIPE